MCSILQWWGSYFIRFANFAEFVSQKVISLHWFGNFYWKTIWPNIIQWSNTVKDSCSLHVRTITWWNQPSPVVNRTSFFFFRWKLQHAMFWPQILFVLLFRWQLLYNVLWSRYLQIWLCCWRMWNGMLCEQLRAKLYRWKLHCVVLLWQLLSGMY